MSQLLEYQKELERKLKILYEAIEEIAFYGISKPIELNGDDEDGWYKRIALDLINKAAIARRECR